MTRIQRQALFLLACSQTVTLLLMTSQTTRVMIYESHDTAERSSEPDAITVAGGSDAYDGNVIDNFSVTTRHVVEEKVLLPAGAGVVTQINDDNGDDELTVKKDAKLLINMINDDQRRSMINDGGNLNDMNISRRSPHPPCRTNQRCVQDRLEHLGRVILSAKYEMEEMMRRKRLEPAVAEVSQIIANWKLSSNSSRLRPTSLIRQMHRFDSKKHERLPAWKRFHNGITWMKMYSEGDGVVDELLQDLRTQPVVRIKPVEKESGSQAHFMYKMQNKGKALFKPQRVHRDYERSVDFEIFHDLERHTAEIAAFHLDRIIGFRRVPPTAGRKMSFIEDIMELEGSRKATGKTYINDAGHYCFDGLCEANCDDRNPICADDNQLLEGSLSAEFPIWNTNEFENPYYTVCFDCDGQIDMQNFQLRFHPDSDYCSTHVRRMEMFDGDTPMLHFVDIQIFDFFIGNLDRHHLSKFDDELFGRDSFLVAYDNGKGFGSSERDEINLLAPLYQCCMVRASTVDRLLQLYSSPDRLSDVMRRSLKADVLDRVLTEPFLAALDRRLAIVLEEIHKCTLKHPNQAVIMDDGL